MPPYKLVYAHELFCLDNNVSDKTIDDIICQMNMLRIIRAYNPVTVKLCLAESTPLIKLATDWQKEMTIRLEHDRKEYSKRYRIAEIYCEEFERQIFRYVTNYE